MFVRYDSKEGFTGLLHSIKHLKDVPAITNDVKNALNTLNPTLISNAKNLEEISWATGSTDANYLNFVKGIKNGSVSLKEGQSYLEGYQGYLQSLSNSLTFATIKIAAFKTAAKIVNTIAWIEIFTLAMKAWTKLKNYFVHAFESPEKHLKKLKKNGEEAAQSIDSLNDKIKNTISTVNKAGDTYSKLVSSIHNLGKATQSQGTLSVEEYKDFLEASNELAELFPQLIIGYDNNGNALLNLGDNAETSTAKLRELLETEKELANQKIIDNISDAYEGSKAAIKLNDYELRGAEYSHNNLHSLQKSISNNKTISFSNEDMMNNGEIQEYYSHLVEAVKSLNIPLEQYRQIVYRNGSDFIVDLTQLTEKQFELLERYITTENLTVEQQYNALAKKNEVENDKIASYMKQWAKIDNSISTLLSSSEADVLDNIFDNLDWSQIPEDFNKAIQKIQLEIIPLIKDNPEIGNAFNGLFDSEQTVTEYEKALNTIKEYYNSNGLEIPAYLNLDYTGSNGETINEYIKDITDKASYELPDGTKLVDFTVIQNLKTLSKKDLEIVANVYELGDTWDDVLEKIKAYKADLKETGSTSLIQPFKNISETVDQIKNDLSSAFKELGSVYSEIFEINSDTGEIDFSLDDVNIHDMFSGLKEAFSELEGFDTSNLEDFFAVLSNGNPTADDVQKAFNRLAGAYLYSSEVMDKLNKETAESVAKQLEAMGITNANALVNEALSLKESWVTKAKENNISTTHDLNNATYEEISALKDENGQLDETEQKLYAFWMEKNIVNDTTIDTNADINNLIGLMKASGKACEALTKLYKLKSTLAELEELHNKGAINAETYERALNTTTTLIQGGTIKDDFTGQTSNIKDLLAEAQKEVSSYYSDFFAGQNNVTFNGNINTQSKDSIDNSNNSSEKSLQTFDWIETKVNNLTEALNNLKETSDDTYTSWADRSTALANAINTTRQAIDLQQQAYNRYMQEAEKSVLPDVYKNLIQNGAIDITAIDDDNIKEKISDYQSWYDKAKNCLDVQEDLKNSLNELNSKKFDNIQSIFDFDISKTEHLITMLNSQTDKLEMKGLFATESYYNQMLQYTQSKINSLTNERKQLADIMNSSTLSHDSEAWRNMYSTLSETDEQLSDLNKDLIEFNNNIRDLNWEIFEYLEESINRITDETEYLIELVSKEDLFDKDSGNLNKYADAVLGLHAAAYDTYRQQAKDYYEEVSDLQKQLVNGAGKDVLEQYSDMLKAHQDAVLAAEDEKQAMLDLIEEGYNAQLEAIQKIIDKKKEQMSAEKNLYDYQKTIKEKTDNISSLEKQQAAYAKDDSEETMSKIQQLKVQLEDAKADLRETEYEQYLSDTENMLDELSKDYEEWMNARLDNEDALLSEIIGTVSDKGDEINATINSVAKEYGTMVSDSITSIFNSASPFTNIITNGFNSVSSSIAGTTSAIDRLIAQVAGITNANAGKTNAGSGTSGSGNRNYNSSSGSSAVNKNTGSNGYSNGYNSSSGSNNNSADSSKVNAEQIFIHKTDTYPKNKLNTETSIVDRLKYYNFDSSFSARASYYSKLGGSGTYRGSDSQNTWLIQKMKSMGYKKGTNNAKAGFHWTQENGEEIIVRKSDGAVLTHLNKGDLVLDNESSQILWEFSQNPGTFMKKFGMSNITPQINITAPVLPAMVGSNASAPLSMNVGDIEINLPNVKNYDEFKNQLIKDGNFEKAMFSAINHAATGKGNVFDKMKYTR